MPKGSWWTLAFIENIRPDEYRLGLYDNGVMTTIGTTMASGVFWFELASENCALYGELSSFILLYNTWDNKSINDDPTGRSMDCWLMDGYPRTQHGQVGGTDSLGNDWELFVRTRARRG